MPAFCFIGMHTDDTTSKLLEICSPVCEGGGYELVDLRFKREPGGWVLRVFVDLLPGAPPERGITHEDCERVSRELSAVLDVADPISQAYSLEVSSPGIDRPLRTEEHFRQYCGKEARVSLHEGVDGRRNFRGRLEEIDQGVLTMVVDDKRYQLPLDDIVTAKLVPDWEALL